MNTPRATAESLAKKQREISVSEFFSKNRHLLGFDNPAKALLTTVKEAVDNSLDACEEAGILPSIRVEIIELGPAVSKDTESKSSRFRVAVEDNGPGIVRAQIGKIFAKLLYGSKFHRLKQSRGQQGIGISAAGLFGQLTTGQPMVVTSKTSARSKPVRTTLRIDTKRNAPETLKEIELTDPEHPDFLYWSSIEHGTRVEIELVGIYRAGRTGVDAYLEQTLVANPHLELYFQPPKGEPAHHPRTSSELPREAKEIQPHPHGIEFGMLLKMLQDAGKRKLLAVLTEDFSRISEAVAVGVCEQAGVSPKASASALLGPAAENLHKALQERPIPPPSASCIVPIGEDLLIAGLRRRFHAEFYASTTRPPAVYRGNPFVVEVGLAFGGQLPLEEQAEIMRFANRVPLQYQPRACAISEAIYDVNWKNYGLQQPKGSLPVGPIAILVHIASVWVPFTSEAKEAVAHYPELMTEIQLALREVGRKLGQHLRARDRANADAQRRSIFLRYIPEVSASLSRILRKDKPTIEQLFMDNLSKFAKIREVEIERPEDESPAAAAALVEVPALPPSDPRPSDPPPKGRQLSLLLGADFAPPKTPKAQKKQGKGRPPVIHPMES